MLKLDREARVQPDLPPFPKASEDEQQRRDLAERLKELTFLHRAASLLDSASPPEATLRTLVELLPAALRHPELAGARIGFDGALFASAAYAPSAHARSAAFEIGGRPGFVEVSYADLGPDTPELLPEEEALLGSCAALVKSYLERSAGAPLAELQQALERERAARAESRLKDEFLGTVSHELRSSLHVMRGWVSILRQTPHADTTLERGLTILERNIALQTKLIEDLLDLSRMLSGKIKLEPKLLDMAELVGYALDAKRPTAEAKGVRIEAELDAVGLVLADQQRLQQVVYNVLDNAVKFTPAGGHVHVRLHTEGRTTLRLCVQDSGVGVDPALLPHVFERFCQAERGARGGGLGLGLAISRHLIESHGGSISATSAGPGKGFCVEIALPRRDDAG